MREYLYQIVCVRVPPYCVYMVSIFYFIGWRCRWVDLNNHSAINWANRLDSFFSSRCAACEWMCMFVSVRVTKHNSRHRVYLIFPWRIKEKEENTVRKKKHITPRLCISFDFFLNHFFKETENFIPFFFILLRDDLCGIQNCFISFFPCSHPTFRWEKNLLFLCTSLIHFQFLWKWPCGNL